MLSGPITSEEPPLRVHGVLWNALTGLSLGYALTEMMANLPKDKVERYLWCLRGHLEHPHDFERVALPSFVFRALCKAGVPLPVQGRMASEVALRQVCAGDFVYVWPPYDLQMIRRSRARGAIVIAERTNCMAGTCRQVLSAAYARRGLALPEGSVADATEELERVTACDFVTAPNPFVATSLRDSGIPDGRIIEISYGFSPSRLAKAIAAEKPLRPPVFAFVGMGIVRKGLDVLLEAWEQANVQGRLLIGGIISDDLRTAYANVLERPDVEELGYVDDVAAIYGAADVFVFPTHEEGGPLVTYEAAACGLPSIVSPMGAGRIIRDQKEGLIVDPLDVHALANAISRLAGEPTLRRELGANSIKRAQNFTWDKVGERFYRQLLGIKANGDAQAAVIAHAFSVTNFHADNFGQGRETE